MPYITSNERLAREEGLAESRRETASLMLRLTRKRFAGLHSGDEEVIRALSVTRLEDLSEALLDFSRIEDLRQWLSRPPDDEPRSASTP